MAPHWPAELDVFSEPHSRMKKLVHKYSNMVSTTDFSDGFHMKSLLQNLIYVFCEFKTHEQIENNFIMRNLKRKLNAAHVTSAAVCNCHSDNRLTDMLEMVVNGSRSCWTEKSIKERQSYGRQLQGALEDFTQNFLPHMEEEEEVFQPLLMKYFSYEELKELKARVIHEHLVSTQSEKFIEDLYQTDDTSVVQSQPSYFDCLPDEICGKIFSYLNPQDLGRAAQTCQHWNRLAKDPSLWLGIYPVHWAMGNWTFHPDSLGGVDGAGEFDPELMVEFDPVLAVDEDADVDESSSCDDDDANKYDYDEDNSKIVKEAKMLSAMVKHLLPFVGSGVKVVDLAYSKGLSSSVVHKILKLCPNIEVLDLTHTFVGDDAFHEYGVNNRRSKLRHLDLTNCHNITDQTLFSLVGVSITGKSLDIVTESADQKDSINGEQEMEVEIENASACRCRHFEPRTNSTLHSMDSSVNDRQIRNGKSCCNTTNKLKLSKEGKCDKAFFGEKYLISSVCDNESVRELNNDLQLTPVFKSITLKDDNRGEFVKPSCTDDLCRSESSNSHGSDRVRNLSTSSSDEEEWRRCHLSTSEMSAVFSSPSRYSSHSSSCGGSASSLRSNVSMDFTENVTTTDALCCNDKNIQTQSRISPLPNHHACSSTSAAKAVCCSAADNGHDYHQEGDVDSNPHICASKDIQTTKPLIHLEFLSLNGCFMISDRGLGALSASGGTPQLHHLDLSGCMGLTGESIGSLVSTCGPQLDHDHLFYCHNISSDPHPTTASGCRNVGCGTRFCCSVD